MDEFILIASNLKQSHTQTLMHMDAPFIVWGIPVPPFTYCSVTGDNLAGGILATELSLSTAI
jgi:hypothetical protein